MKYLFNDVRCVLTGSCSPEVLTCMYMYLPEVNVLAQLAVRFLHQLSRSDVRVRDVTQRLKIIKIKSYESQYKKNGRRREVNW